MGTRRTGAKVEQLHRIEMDAIPQIHHIETLCQYIDIPVPAGG
jgi:hypothetical protein